MSKRNPRIIKWAQTALLAALCYVVFQFLQIKIPMPGGAESLNASVAAAVLLYEAVRQRITK